jgi:PilZ domain
MLHSGLLTLVLSRPRRPRVIHIHTILQGYKCFEGLINAAQTKLQVKLNFIQGVKMAAEFTRSVLTDQATLALFVARGERYEVRQPIMVSIDRFDVPGEIVNVSISGVGIRLSVLMRLQPGNRVGIHNSTLGKLNGTVRWCSHPNYGLELSAKSRNSPEYAAFIAGLQDKPKS